MAEEKEIKYEIIKEIAIIYENPNPDGWDKVVNLISWNGGKPKLDIRSWNKDRTRMGKGISLSADEFHFLIQEVKDLEF